MRRYLPDLAFLALLGLYGVACWHSPSAWWVIVGYLCGWGTELCLQWKRNP